MSTNETPGSPRTPGTPGTDARGERRKAKGEGSLVVRGDPGVVGISNSGATDSGFLVLKTSGSVELRC